MAVPPEATEWKGLDLWVTLRIETRMFNGRWQARYHHSDGSLLVFNCDTEQEAKKMLTGLIVDTLQEYARDASQG